MQHSACGGLREAAFSPSAIDAGDGRSRCVIANRPPRRTLSRRPLVGQPACSTRVHLANRGSAQLVSFAREANRVQP